MASIMNKMKTKKVQKTNINTKKGVNILEQREEFIINLPKNLAYLKLKNTEKNSMKRKRLTLKLQSYLTVMAEVWLKWLTSVAQVPQKFVAL